VLPKHALIAEQAIAEFGKQVTIVALPLIAIIHLDFGPGLVAVMSTLSGTAALLGAGANAWLSQRLSLFALILLAMTVSVVCLGSIPTFSLIGVLSANMLIAAAIGTSAVGSIYRVGVIALIPRLVPSSELVKLNGRVNLAQSLVAVLCPLVVGSAAMVVTPAYLLSFNAATWLISGIVLGGLVLQAGPPTRQEAFVESSRPGGRFWRSRLWGKSSVWFGLGCQAVLTVLRSAAMTVIVLLIIDVLGASEFAVGIVFTIGGVGFAAGAALASFFSGAMSYARTMAVASATAGLSGIGLIASAGGYWLGVVGASAFAGSSAAAALVLAVAFVSMWQSGLKADELALVASTNEGLATAMRLLGAALAGTFGVIFGVMAVVLLVGGVYVVVGVLLGLTILFGWPREVLRESH